jgi:hypothetical protein
MSLFQRRGLCFIALYGLCFLFFFYFASEGCSYLHCRVCTLFQCGYFIQSVVVYCTVGVFSIYGLFRSTLKIALYCRVEALETLRFVDVCFCCFRVAA